MHLRNRLSVLNGLGLPALVLFCACTTGPDSVKTATEAPRIQTVKSRLGEHGVGRRVRPVQVTASSSWTGMAPELALDGDDASAWCAASTSGPAHSVPGISRTFDDYWQVTLGDRSPTDPGQDVGSIHMFSGCS